MTTSVLEINDWELSLFRDGQLTYQAPAIALVREGEIVFGEPALRLSRTHPRETVQQYLARLNADPLPHPVRGARNHADLTYLHLRELAPLVSGELLLAVPGILSNDQLGVLLGIIQETGMTVRGFVDAAVAAAVTADAAARAYHVDVHLQRACVTELSADSAHVGRTTSLDVPDCGIANLLDGWVNVIADRFVRNTRFDPLHAAETEQQLYDQVYDWAAAGRHGREIGIEIDYRNHVRRVELPHSLLEDKAAQRLARLCEALEADVPVLLSARAARLAGLAPTLEQRGHTVIRLDTAAIAAGCHSRLDEIRSDADGLRLVTRLSTRGDVRPAPGAAPGTAPGAAPPTHVLSGATARPLAARDHGLPIAIDGDVIRLEANGKVRLNGQPLAGPAALKTGDRVEHGDAEYLVIRVEP